MNVKKWDLIVFLVLLIANSIGCEVSGNDNSVTVTPSPTPIASTPPNQTQFTKVDGIVVFDTDEAAMKRSDGLIRIYDESGDVWHVVNYFDDSMDAMAEEGGKFRPFNYQSGNFKLQMLCTGKSEDWYSVIVQGETSPRLTMYVKTNDPLLKYMTWKEYLVGNKNLRFDPKNNPVLNAPNGVKIKVDLDSLNDWFPISLKGDWLHITWGEENKNKQGPLNIREGGGTGWIRWRDNDGVLVGEFYR